MFFRPRRPRVPRRGVTLVEMLVAVALLVLMMTIIVQVFAAALVKGAKEPEASKRLIAFLASEKATPAIEKTGMKRPGPR